MKYLLMITEIEGAWDRILPAEQERLMARHQEFGRQLAADGKLVEAHRLRPRREAKTLRIAGDERVLTDGPFAETKEVMGGYYVVQCASMEEAVEWARRLPASYGSIEVRPIWE